MNNIIDGDYTIGGNIATAYGNSIKVEYKVKHKLDKDIVFKSVKFLIPIGKSADHLAALGASARSYDLFNCRQSPPAGAWTAGFCIIT